MLSKEKKIKETSRSLLDLWAYYERWGEILKWAFKISTSLERWEYMANKENTFEFTFVFLSRALLRTLTTLIKCHTNTAIVVRDESGIIFSHCRLDFKVPEMLSELQKAT